MNDKLTDTEFYGKVIFVGETLGPFFLEDPATGNIAPAFDAMKTLAVEEAAREWPFVSYEAAARCLSALQDDLKEPEDPDDLMWEYRRLFIGPAAKPAPPWGSVYMDRECVVFGNTTLELRQWMRETGIVWNHDEKTPEDHIGLMLLLMAWVAENKPEQLEEYLIKHLLTWSSHFLTQLSDAAEMSFYRGLADLTKASLEGIQQELGLEVEYPRYYQ